MPPSVRPSAAHQSLKVADDPRGGLLFRLWLHRPKARLWFYEFAWISCSSSRTPLAPVDDRTPPQGNLLDFFFFFFFTHGSYISFNFFSRLSSRQQIIPLIQFECAQEIQLALPRLLFSSTYFSPTCAEVNRYLPTWHAASLCTSQDRSLEMSAALHSAPLWQSAARWRKKEKRKNPSQHAQHCKALVK